MHRPAETDIVTVALPLNLFFFNCFCLHRPADTDKATEALSELNQEGLAAFEKCVGLLRGLGHELGRCFPQM